MKRQDKGAGAHHEELARLAERRALPWILAGLVALGLACWAWPPLLYLVALGLAGLVAWAVRS